jgi:hypothetical protein
VKTSPFATPGVRSWAEATPTVDEANMIDMMIRVIRLFLLVINYTFAVGVPKKGEKEII